MVRCSYDRTFFHLKEQESFLKAKLLYNYGRFVRPSKRSYVCLSHSKFRHVCHINFKLGMMIPLTVGYDLETAATLQYLQENQYVNLKHANVFT